MGGMVKISILQSKIDGHVEETNGMSEILCEIDVVKKFFLKRPKKYCVIWNTTHFQILIPKGSCFFLKNFKTFHFSWKQEIGQN